MVSGFGMDTKKRNQGKGLVTLARQIFNNQSILVRIAREQAQVDDGVNQGVAIKISKNFALTIIYNEDKVIEWMSKQINDKVNFDDHAI